MDSPSNNSRFLHHYWANYDRTAEPPEDVSGAIKASQQAFADYHAIQWSFKEVSELLETINPDFAELFTKLTIPAMQSDIARLAVLYRYGGLYLDAAIVPTSSQAADEFLQLAEGTSLLVVESKNDPAVLMNRLIVAKKELPAILQVLDLACNNVRESMERNDKAIDVWQLTGSQLSAFVNTHGDNLPGLKRLEFTVVAALFTRRVCDYKTRYWGNWDQLQAGDRAPVYLA